MKPHTVLVLLLISLFSYTVASPPQQEGFRFLGYDIGDQFVVLNYDLPFDGMVELRIFTDEATLVWKNQYVNERGENAIRLKSSAFESGRSYTLQLNYKQDVFRKEFTLNR